MGCLNRRAVFPASGAADLIEALRRPGRRTSPSGRVVSSRRPLVAVAAAALVAVIGVAAWIGAVALRARERRAPTSAAAPPGVASADRPASREADHRPTTVELLRRAIEIDDELADAAEAARFEARREELATLLDAIIAGDDPRPEEWPPTLVRLAQARAVAGLAGGPPEAAARLIALLGRTRGPAPRPTAEQTATLRAVVALSEPGSAVSRERALLAALLLDRYGDDAPRQAVPDWEVSPDWLDGRADRERALPEPDPAVLAFLATRPPARSRRCSARPGGCRRRCRRRRCGRR